VSGCGCLPWWGWVLAGGGALVVWLLLALPLALVLGRAMRNEDRRQRERLSARPLPDRE